jgi:pyridoxine 5-phosphate synthase
VTHFSCNINRIALLRNSRSSVAIPNLMDCARIALDAGAYGITIHPRPDERHIRHTDVEPLAALIRKYAGREFNIEGNPHHNLMPLVQAHRPHQTTFVPDSVGQATSDHGFAPGAMMEAIVPLIAQAKAWGVRTSVFVDANADAIEAAKAAGADRIELYTEPYAIAHGQQNFQAVLRQFAQAAAFARKIGLGVNAGHDLNLNNLPPFIDAVGPDEVSIGHAVIGDDVTMGLERAVKAYIAACTR